MAQDLRQLDEMESIVDLLEGCNQNSKVARPRQTGSSNMIQVATERVTSIQVDAGQSSATTAGCTDQIALKLAKDPNELMAAFRLIYESYYRAGLVDPIEGGMRVTAHQLEETSEVFIAMKGETVISTVSLIKDGRLGLPIEKVYGAEIKEMRRANFQLGEVSCLADRRASMARSMPMFLNLMRLLGQHAVLQGVHRIVIAVHPRHARFYKRLIGFQQIGDERQYAAVLDQPAVALYKDLNYGVAPNTRIFDSFFAEPCPRHELLRPMRRPADFVARMLSLA